METLRATEPLRIDGLCLILVQRVRIDRSQVCGTAWVQACAEPRALVIGEQGRWRALDPEGAETALAPLLEEVGGLADIVQRERCGHSGAG